MDITGTITAVEAAEWLGVSYKTVLRHIKSGAIPAVKVASNRYAIRLADLPARLAARSMLARLDAVERRLSALEQKKPCNLSVRPYNAQEGYLPPKVVSSIVSRGFTGPSDGYTASLSAYDEAPAWADSRSEIARFLQSHGIKASTAEKWRDCPLSFDGALFYAMRHIEAIGWRARQVGMRLVRCGKADCPCIDIIEGE